MSAHDPGLIELLCEPGTLAPVRPVPGGLETESGVFYPDTDGFPSLMPSERNLRARIWEWVYNRTAFGYDFGVRFAWRLPLGGAPIDRQAYLSRLSFQPGMRLLDTGTGTGDNLLAAPGSVHLFGIDQAAGMLQRCRRKLARAGRTAGLVRADMHAVPFKTGLFDIVLHMGGLQFLSQPGRAIADWHRTAAAGGRVVIVEENTSIAAVVRRAAVHNVEALVPPGAKNLTIQEVSSGELLMIDYTKA